MAVGSSVLFLLDRAKQVKTSAKSIAIMAILWPITMPIMAVQYAKNSLKQQLESATKEIDGQKKSKLTDIDMSGANSLQVNDIILNYKVWFRKQ